MKTLNNVVGTRWTKVGQRTLAVQLCVHLRVLFLEPFLTLFGSAAEFAVLSPHEAVAKQAWRISLEDLAGCASPVDSV